MVIHVNCIDMPKLIQQALADKTIEWQISNPAYPKAVGPLLTNPDLSLADESTPRLGDVIVRS